MTEQAKSNSGAQIKSIVERVENLNEQKAALASDVKDIFAEAKSNGFDTKALRTLIKLRAIDPSKRKAEAEMLDVYMHAIGMLE